MREKILVSDFVEKVKEFEDKEQALEYIKTVVTRHYSPIMEKRVVLETMLNKAVTTEANGIVYIDQFVTKVNLRMAVIILYTNLQPQGIVKESGKTIYDDYDALQEIDAFSAIAYLVGESEIKELAQVQETIMNTFYERHTSTEAVINRLMENLTVLLKVVGESAEKKLAEALIQSESETKEVSD